MNLLALLVVAKGNNGFVFGIDKHFARGVSAKKKEKRWDAVMCECLVFGVRCRFYRD